MAQYVATEKLSIEDWVKALAAIPESEFTLQNVQDYVIRHAVRQESLEKYCFFSKGNYTRNLVFRNALFECMTLCWDIGQHSRIHNHRGQNCWMSAPIGRLRIQNYRVDNRDASKGTCRIVPTELYDLDSAHPTYVNPMEPVHEVMNLAEFSSVPSASTSIRSPLTLAKSTTATKAPTPMYRSSSPANTASSILPKSSYRRRPPEAAVAGRRVVL